jgi:hypothetical protein
MMNVFPLQKFFLHLSDKPEALASLANAHNLKGEPLRGVAQYRGSGTCELYVVERRKNRLDILEGHSSNKETRRRFQLERCKR